MKPPAAGQWEVVWTRNGWAWDLRTESGSHMAATQTQKSQDHTAAALWAHTSLLLNTLPSFWPRQVLRGPEQTLPAPEGDLRPGGQPGWAILARSTAQFSGHRHCDSQTGAPPPQAGGPERAGAQSCPGASRQNSVPSSTV